jgi:O-antigen ligase
VDALNSLKDSRKLYLMLMYFIAASYLNTADKRMLSLKFFAAGTAFIGIYTSCTGFYNRFIMHNQDFRSVSFSGNHMHAGGMLMLGAVTISALIFYYFRDTKKNIKPLLLLVPAFAVIVTGLLFTFTRGSWIAAIIGIIVAALLINKKMLVAVVIVLLAAGLFLKDTAFMNRMKSSFIIEKNSSSSERMLMWKSGINMIKDRPVTGIGTANVDKVYPKYKSPDALEQNQGHLHNNFIQIAVIDGIPGTIIFIALFGVLFVSMFRIYLKSGGLDRMTAACGTAVIAAFFINGFFEYNFFSSQVALLFWFLAGLGVSAGKETEK